MFEIDKTENGSTLKVTKCCPENGMTVTQYSYEDLGLHEKDIKYNDHVICALGEILQHMGSLGILREDDKDPKFRIVIGKTANDKNKLTQEEKEEVLYHFHDLS